MKKIKKHSKIDLAKFVVAHKEGETSIHIKIRMNCQDNMKHSILRSRQVQINEYGFFEILPKIFDAEN